MAVGAPGWPGLRVLALLAAERRRAGPMVPPVLAFCPAAAAVAAALQHAPAGEAAALEVQLAAVAAAVERARHVADDVRRPPPAQPAPMCAHPAPRGRSACGHLEP